MSDIEKRALLLNNFVRRLTGYFTQVQESCIKVAGSMTLHEMKIIEYLGINKKAIMRDLARHLKLAESTMTTVADKMVKRGLILRQYTEEDRRIVNIILSDEGEKIFLFTQNAALKSRTEMLETLSDEEQKTLLDLLEKMTDKLEINR